MDAAKTEVTAQAGNPAGEAEHAHEQPHGGRRGDTRARIQQVALELFAEQGYERTSLREIAERLSVTKAALYYHFKSKEDIVRSFTEDYFSRLDALIAWGSEQPPGPRTAYELLDRYISVVMESGEVFRFLERNQATIHGTEDGKHRFTQFRPRLAALMEIITGPDAPPRSRIRAAAAIFAVSTSCMFFMKDAPEAELDAILPAPPSPQELREILLEFANDLAALPEHHVVSGRAQRVLDVRAVRGTAGLDLEHYLDLVDAQGGREPLMADLEHVRAQAGEQAEQCRERAWIIGDPAAEAEVPPGGRQPVPQQLGQQQRVDVAAGEHDHGGGLDFAEAVE
jgi:AcrR family transcriptional regulator